jgi:hypothetical protein
MGSDDVQQGLEFATHFAEALIKLRSAQQRAEGVTLTADDVSAVIAGFALLKDRSE